MSDQLFIESIAIIASELTVDALEYYVTPELTVNSGYFSIDMMVNIKFDFMFRVKNAVLFLIVAN